MADKQALQALFADAYDRDRWLKQLHEIFAGRLEVFSVPRALPARKGEDATDRQPESHHLGNLITGDDKKLGVYEIRVGTNARLARNRVQLRNLVARQVQADTLDGALAVYPDDYNRWRFSYIAVTRKLDEQGAITREETAHKRYTYLLGEGMQTRTAVERFADLPTPPTLEQLDYAFATEPLNREFYSKLYHWYDHAKGQVTFPNDESVEQEVHNANSLIRLLTRLLFVWFMKEKGLANPDLFDLGQVKQRIDWERPSGYYKAILQNLFFATLNREIKDRQFRTTTDGKANGTNYQITNLYRYQDYFKDRNKKKIIELFAQTPFLNGGLFECLDRQADKEEIAAYERNKSIRKERKEKRAIRMDGFSDRKDNVLCVPNDLFFNDDENQPGLINVLSQYQFTVEESAPLDVEVALDPELLGLVFENLLAAYNPETKASARDETGSYYTPREVVAYMVDESLKAYLVQAVPPEDGDAVFYRERLDDLFGGASRTGELSELEKEDGTACIYEQEIPRLIEAISRINILDPAVGSGAFPMGALQRMVSLLAILDPDNERWKEQQLARLPDLQSIEQDLKTAGKISDREARRKAEEELHKRKREIQTLFAGQDHDYLRKLYLIENCLFGVDIQPIAIQIAKLRFFISLVIEQKDPTADKDDNYGILALPNLETRFVVADTLIGLSKPEQCALRCLDIDAKEKQLQEVRHKHFNAKTLRTKRKYREQDEQLRGEIAELLRDDGWQDADAGKIAHWNPYDQNASAAWFDPEWMFGVKDGFDVVIGNPPYVRQENIGPKKPILLEQYADAVSARSDLYCYFYVRGLQLLRDGGMHVFVCSNSWLDVGYGAKLQEYLLKDTHVQAIYESAIERQFSTADINTIISVIRKTTGDDDDATRFVHLLESFEAAVAERGRRREIVKSRAELLTAGTSERKFVGDKWGGKYLRAPDIYHAILNKCANKLVRLGDIATVRCGIKTGANDFFYLTPKVIAKWGIEPKFYRPVMTSPQESRRIAVNPANLRHQLFMCPEDKAALSGTGALAYIEWGERQGYHRRSSVASRRRWYDLGDNLDTKLALGCRVDTTSRTLLAVDGLCFDKAFYKIDSGKLPTVQTCAVLNSTMTQLMINIEGRVNFGGGLLEIMVYETAHLAVLHPSLLPVLDSDLFASSDWDVLTPSPERRQIDDAVFDALGLTAGEREAVYTGVTELVENRKQRAQSVG